MTNLDIVQTAMRSLGRADALSLRSAAAGMDSTSLIAEEAKVPAWDSSKDYSGWPVGGPVQHQGQVYKLLQPHDAANTPDACPSNFPALWSIARTKDPARAKPWQAPQGTSGMYMTGECVLWTDGAIYRCQADDTVHDPDALPGAWEVVSMLDTTMI